MCKLHDNDRGATCNACRYKLERFYKLYKKAGGLTHGKAWQRLTSTQQAQVKELYDEFDKRIREEYGWVPEIFGKTPTNYDCVRCGGAFLRWNREKVCESCIKKEKHYRVLLSDYTRGEGKSETMVFMEKQYEKDYLEGREVPACVRLKLEEM